MSKETNIEWADSTFNPWIGCTKISPACDHCYAAVATPSRTLGVEWGAGKPRHRTSAANWKQPLKWNRIDEANQNAWDNMKSKFGLTDAGMEARGFMKPRRRRVFCASLADWLDNEVPAEWLADLLSLIASTPNLDWLLLTKRIGNLDRRLRAAQEVFAQRSAFGVGDTTGYGLLIAWQHGRAPANAWIGTTICNQAEADRDVPKLLGVPAAVRFLSIEPMLGPIDLEYPESLYPNGPAMCCSGVECGCYGQPIEPPMLYGINWVITGGESGSHARPSRPDWFRSLRDQCAAAGVPFMFKQWGEFAPPVTDEHVAAMRRGEGHGAALDSSGTFVNRGHAVVRVGKKAGGRLLDGVTHDGYPSPAGA